MGKSSVTAPKGRPTRARNQVVGGRRFVGSTTQWIAVIILAAAIMAAIFYFGRDFRSDVGAPADVAAIVAAIVVTTLSG